MAENRKIWPLLVYGGLAAIAAARRAQTERTPAIVSREIGREPRRITYPAPDESGESQGESRPAAQVDPDKRPKEQVENDQPISAQLRRAKEGTARNGSLGNSVGRVERYLLARLC